MNCVENLFEGGGACENLVVLSMYDGPIKRLNTSG